MKQNKTSIIPTITVYVVGKIFNLKIENNKTNVATTCIPNITGHEITFLIFLGCVLDGSCFFLLWLSFL